VLKEELDRGMHRRRLDQVIVVQHQHDLLGQLRQLVDESGHRALQRGRWRSKQRGHPLGDPGPDRVQGGGHMAPESRRVVVRLI
jgi:hypothetical protein